MMMEGAAACGPFLVEAAKAQGPAPDESGLASVRGRDVLPGDCYERLNDRGAGLLLGRHVLAPIDLVVVSPVDDVPDLVIEDR